MSRSELHNWECAIERLSGDNADKMIVIAQDIYNTAFVRGKNYMSLEQTRNDVLDKISAEIEEIETYDGIYIDRYYVLEILDKHKAESE